MPTVVHLCFGYAAVVTGLKPTGYSFLPQLADTILWMQEPEWDIRVVPCNDGLLAKRQRSLGLIGTERVIYLDDDLILTQQAALRISDGIYDAPFWCLPIYSVGNGGIWSGHRPLGTDEPQEHPAYRHSAPVSLAKISACPTTACGFEVEALLQGIAASRYDGAPAGRE